MEKNNHFTNGFANVFSFKMFSFNQDSPMQILSDHCKAPKKIGPCRGSFPRWHFNAASQKCENFLFGGCRENLNNYLTEKECNTTCSILGI